MMFIRTGVVIGTAEVKQHVESAKLKIELILAQTESRACQVIITKESKLRTSSNSKVLNHNFFLENA